MLQNFVLKVDGRMDETSLKKINDSSLKISALGRGVSFCRVFCPLSFFVKDFGLFQDSSMDPCKQRVIHRVSVSGIFEVGEL